MFKKQITAPYIIFAIYILLTLALNVWGPKKYLYYNYQIEVVIYILIFLILFWRGYSIGIKKKDKENTNYKNGVDTMLGQLSIWINISVLLYVFFAFYLFSSGKLYLNILEMGANYVTFNEEYESGGTFTIENVFLVLAAIPKFYSLCLGFLLFNKLTKYVKLKLVVLVLLIIICHTISAGNQKSIGDIVILFVMSRVYYLSQYSKEKKKRILKRLLLLGCGFYFLMCFSQYSRLQFVGIEGVDDLNSRMRPYVYFDKNHVLFKTLGEDVGLGVASFTTGYLTDGYYGLSKCMELPFEWTYGVGSSDGLGTVFEKITGVKIYENTYLGRMEKTYWNIDLNGRSQWHSVFPWLASDFTFVGALIIFYFIGMLYGRCWKDILVTGNMYSYVLFSLISICLIFVPCNNQIWQGYDYIVITSFTFLSWLRNHSKYKIWEINC